MNLFDVRSSFSTYRVSYQLIVLIFLSKQQNQRLYARTCKSHSQCHK